MRKEWKNISPLATIAPMSGDTVDELMEYWEGKHMQVFYAIEWLDNLENEYIFEGVPNDIIPGDIIE